MKTYNDVEGWEVLAGVSAVLGSALVVVDWVDLVTGLGLGMALGRGRI